MATGRGDGGEAATHRGAQPTERARPLIVEAFERKLGRPVTYEELGLVRPKSAAGDGPRDTVESLIGLGKDDMNPSRRGLLGDRRAAFARLRETEAALAKADSRRESVGRYDRAAYLFHVSHVHYEGRDLPASIGALKQSIKASPRQERQGRLHANAVLAQRQCERGHVEEACASWEVFLDDYMVLPTARGDEHFATMRKSLARYPKAGAVRAMDERVRTVAAQKG
ncbi:hypothetical protein OG909_07605 [Streptomyces sp. NBC_01754]|uniref:hypothetical protein n=1 Tax=Streptomyces sp. NBC_01754 TaxID=2975930 RepID=UPI002DDA2AB4|nr:hypothetical protein [Streptomyces sp. NBC_01754]WSC92172.1 hypothetical protein OG909_07605 [Streptomyces sp. NBC_01754]